MSPFYSLSLKDLQYFYCCSKGTAVARKREICDVTGLSRVRLCDLASYERISVFDLENLLFCE